jgi:hypothetical protein
MKTISTWLSTWQHVVLTLGMATITVVAAVYVPSTTWDKVEHLVNVVLSNPAAAVGAATTLGTMLSALRYAWMRDPRGKREAEVATTTENADASSSQPPPP